jgi:glycerol-3-phosphate acyltransferase PlsY
MESLSPLLTWLVPALLGYLLGSVPFAVVVSRLFGLNDPRSHGSGNPGATNVLRTGNKAAAALTLIGDAAKGWMAMFVAQKVGAGETAVGIAGLAAFLGHVFPFTLGFKGGKGVATALGVMLGFSGALAGIAMIIWIAVAALTRYSSLAALVAAFCAPVVAWLLIGKLVVALPIAIMSAVLILRHKSNIVKLLAGTESRIGAGKKATTGPNQEI